MITVRQDEEHVLKYSSEEVLKERVTSILVRLGHVADKLIAHSQASTFDFAIVVLTSPHARVNDELELSAVEFQQSRKATKVDGSEKLEELDAVFGVF